MSSIKDCLVQDGELHDDVLHTPCLPVNIRLLKSNIDYRLTIRRIVRTMSIFLWRNYSDYSSLLGISGANVGIPFNIVLIKMGKEQEELVMLNPEIISYSDEKRTVQSNCGSLCLTEPIEVERAKKVTVQYVTFDKPYATRTESFKLGTVQHEIDHNNGTLITDLAVR